MKKNIIVSIIILLFIFTSFYIFLPPLNISSWGFWLYLTFIIFSSTLVILISNLEIKGNEILIKNKKNDHWSAFIMLGSILILPILLVINIIGSPMFNSKAYYERISVNNGEFQTDINEVDFNSIALLDKDSSTKLGDRVMGQLTDLVSQFYVSDLYTQITYNNTITRVTPLEYADLIKYFTNSGEGVPGYITVDSITGESTLTRLDEGMKYMPSAYFNEDLYRKLRFDYLTENFGEMTFELDDSGNPYWIIPTIKYSLIGLREEVDGVIVFNPIDGSSTKYNLEDVPEWVDHVYPSELILSQLTDWGLYKNGFLNSIFSQKEVVMATDGYNYLSFNGDTYLYTGITSVASDESNIGFVMVNLRTKETKFYNVAGAEEFSAMASAEGQVQNLGYRATFPLLVNLNGKPTYLMSLKDDAGLVKMYAFVDYADYQKVVVTDSSLGIEEAAKNYLGKDIIVSDFIETTITVDDITSAVVDGTTNYYLKSDNKVYRASINIAENVLPFLKVNEQVNIKYIETSNGVFEIIEVTN